MSKHTIITGWHGEEHAEMAKHTVPLMRRYALRHGLEFGYYDLSGPRPPSWMKVQAVVQELRTSDAVLWLDVDVVILRGDLNVFADTPDAWQALAVHRTECGDVPNAGVWLVAPMMTAVLERMWHSGKHIDHPWWEQAALIETMGYEVSDGPKATLTAPTSVYEHTAFLPAEWNHHPRDEGRVSPEVIRFAHITQYADRLKVIQDTARAAKI